MSSTTGSNSQNDTNCLVNLQLHFLFLKMKKQKKSQTEVRNLGNSIYRRQDLTFTWCMLTNFEKK